MALNADQGFVDAWVSEVVAEALGPAEILHRLMVRCGRNWGPSLLWDWWEDGLIEWEGLRDRILEVWTMAEYPVWDLGKRRWLDMFGMVGYVSDGPERPDRPLTIYRGAPRAYRRGMAWTTDPEIASRFALSMRGLPGEVWRATVPPHAVLGQIAEGRGEAEVIVNPNCLRGRASPAL